MFTEEEDAFLLNMMHRYGYGNWEVIRMEIRKVGPPDGITEWVKQILAVKENGRANTATK